MKSGFFGGADGSWRCLIGNGMIGLVSKEAIKGVVGPAILLSVAVTGKRIIEYEMFAEGIDGSVGAGGGCSLSVAGVLVVYVEEIARTAAHREQEDDNDDEDDPASARGR